MHEIEVEQPFLNLSGKHKIIAGLLLAVGGIGACVVLWEEGWIAGGALFAAIFGPALALVGLREQARQRAIEAEFARARGEWSELADGIHTTRREGGNIARYLQGKGYREFVVRRWITAELDPSSRVKPE